ncbi:MAG: 16S rRNA (cytidine(1402)-2'-O)-methyltransferase [Arenicellales bacterium]
MGDLRSKAGTLYVVATPIGNLSDMSRRATTILQSVRLIAAEDTRQTAKLLACYSISTPMAAYHEHNEVRQTPVLMRRLLAGEDVALVSDAGSPLVSDPGYRLVSAAWDAEVRVVPIPGPCAAIAALTAAGLPCHRFHFEGFLPAKPGARRGRLDALLGNPDTLIFYESVHRLEDALEDMCTVLGPLRGAALARELTKIHETIRRGSLKDISQWVAARPDERKGEYVVLVEGADEPGDAEGERVLDLLSEELPLGRAADLAARITGSPRNRLYRRALDKRRGR